MKDTTKTTIEQPEEAKPWQDPDLFLLSTDETKYGIPGPGDGGGLYS